MSDPVDNTQKTSLLAQSRERLSAFFKQSSVKKLVSVLVPSAVAAALFPVFGPVVAGAAAVVAVKNGLSLLNIDLSDDTIKKLIKPLEGQEMSEDEMQETLGNTLEELLPADKQVNEEMAKALVVVAPTIKEAALSNSKLDASWLGQSLETNLKQQGEMMEKIAPNVHALMQKDGEALSADVQRLLQNWSRISVEVTATKESKISDVKSKADAAGGAIGHKVKAKDKSTIEKVDIDSKIS